MPRFRAANIQPADEPVVSGHWKELKKDSALDGVGRELAMDTKFPQYRRYQEGVAMPAKHTKWSATVYNIANRAERAAAVSLARSRPDAAWRVKKAETHLPPEQREANQAKRLKVGIQRACATKARAQHTDVKPVRFPSPSRHHAHANGAVDGPLASARRAQVSIIAYGGAPRGRGGP